MANDYDLSEARIYVGTYRKYNNGSLEGDSDTDEFWDACRELHEDEDDPEYMFQDWENIPDSLIGESWLSDEFFEIRDAMDDLNEDERIAFFIWCNDGSRNIPEEDVYGLINSFRDDYQGKYGDEEDFAYHIVDECYELPEFALSYFAYEKFARDLFLDGYWCEDGYVFHRA